MAERDVIILGKKFQRPMGPDSIVKPYAWHMAQGGMLNHKTLNKFGMTDAVTATFTTVWDGENLYPWQTSAQTLSIVGGVEDDPDKGGAVPGTGAWTVRVFGLNASYQEVTEDFTLNGATPVVSTSTWLRVYRVLVLTAGTTGTNVGAITISQGGVARAIIRAGFGQTLMALWTVPAGYEAYLIRVYATTSKVNIAQETRIRVRPFGGAWNTKRTVHINGTSVDSDWSFPLPITEKSDIEIQSMGNTADCAAGFDLWYELA